MSLSRRFAYYANRMYPRLTVDAAVWLTGSSAIGTVDALRRRRHCAVVSYRLDGTAVSTPMWFAVHDGVVYVRSLATAAKVRRIRQCPQTLVAPCTARGRPTGPPLGGTARVVEPDEERFVEAQLRRRYRFGRRVYLRAITDAPAVYIAIVPTQGADETASKAASSVLSAPVER
jgi:PPOX class probable F420-dependent enzyme